MVVDHERPHHGASLPSVLPRYGSAVDCSAEIIIRNEHGAVAGRISWDDAGALVMEVRDEASRGLVEAAAARAGAPGRPRVRPSCGPPADGVSGPGMVM